MVHIFAYKLDMRTLCESNQKYANLYESIQGEYNVSMINYKKIGLEAQSYASQVESMRVIWVKYLL